MKFYCPIAAVAVLALLILAGCVSYEKDVVQEPAHQQDTAIPPAALAVDNSTNFSVKLGCSYGNPPCNSGYYCVSNICILKSGCNYNNPVCNQSHTCVGNSCVLKSGCKYDNPPCNSSQICQNNKCFVHILSSGGGGY